MNKPNAPKPQRQIAQSDALFGTTITKTTSDVAQSRLPGIKKVGVV